jgi:NAD(P)-dependent dehydrogenase (short-subunit alcohol dehydrogenase family)
MANGTVFYITNFVLQFKTIKMKTVLITGANKSIGFETARQLAQKGYFIYLGSRDIAKGTEAAEQLKQEGLTNVEAIAIDVCDKNSVAAAKAVVEAKSGTLDVLINNAGILGDMPQNAFDVSTDEIRKVFDTNFFGTIDVTQAFLPLLEKADVPVIVNVTSGLGSLTLHSDPNWKYYAYKTAGYGVSKAAQNAYTINLAFELKDKGFKINAIDPGYTATDFNNHSGPNSVQYAAAFVAKYADLDANGPTGKYFSPDIETDNNESPW